METAEGDTGMTINFLNHNEHYDHNDTALNAL